jgi:hypothetical protein
VVLCTNLTAALQLLFLCGTDLGLYLLESYSASLGPIAHGSLTTNCRKGLVEDPLDGVLDRLIEHVGEGRDCSETQL